MSRCSKASLVGLMTVQAIMTGSFLALSGAPASADQIVVLTPPPPSRPAVPRLVLTPPTSSGGAISVPNPKTGAWNPSAGPTGNSYVDPATEKWRGLVKVDAARSNPPPRVGQYTFYGRYSPQTNIDAGGQSRR